MNVEAGACGIGNVDGEVLEDANGEVQGDSGEVSEEAMRVRKLVDPKKPSQQEVDEHFLSHLPFRIWRPHCMRGKAKELDCRRSEGAADDLP